MVLGANPLFIRGIGKIGGPILNRIFGGTLRSPVLPKLPKTFGPAAAPIASGGVRTVSTLGKTRAGLNLSNRSVVLLGGGIAGGTISTIALTQPGPSGSSAIETLTEGAKDVTENLGPGLENVTKFVQENGALVALIGLGIVVIVLIK